MPADYVKLKTEISLPFYNGMADDQIITAVNGKTVAAPKAAIIPVKAVVNAIVAADLLALSTNNLLALIFIVSSGDFVDGSPGTTVRAVIQAIFTGKAQTLANLAALVNTYDLATGSWVAANIGIPSISLPDILAARAS